MDPDCCPSSQTSHVVDPDCCPSSQTSHVVDPDCCHPVKLHMLWTLTAVHPVKLHMLWTLTAVPPVKLHMLWTLTAVLPVPKPDSFICSQSVGEGSHHPGEEGEVREAGEGSLSEDQSSLLHPPLLHLPGQGQTLYPCLLHGV